VKEIRGQMSEVRKHRSGRKHHRQGTGRSLRAVCRSVLKPVSDLRLLIFGLCALFFALCISADAQEEKLRRIALLFAGERSAVAGRIEAFRQGLHDRGYQEGKNIVIEYRYGEGNLDRVPSLVEELIRLKVDVIVTGGPADTRAAKQATATIPIVMAQDSDPVGAGVVASLARPGGNVTGLSVMAPEISGKQLELLKEIVPRLSRVAVLGTSTNPGNAQALRETELAGAALGVQIQYLDVQRAEDVESAFSVLKKDRVGAFIVLRNPVTSTHRKRIVDLAVKSRLPAIYPQIEFTEAGGLMSYGAYTPDLYRRAATYVDKILKGAKPGDLPVEQPTKFELVINVRSAKQIELTIPPNVLARADRVIK
jgi:putative tryptophan/tyrosine transport system substrate-binding protein